MPSGKPLAVCLQGLGFLEKSQILETNSKWCPRTKSAVKSIFDFANLDDGACFVGDEKSRYFDQKATDWIKQNGAMYWSAEGGKKLFTHAPAYPEDEDTIFYLVQQIMLGKHASDVSNNKRMSRSQAKSGYDVNIFGVGEYPVNRPTSSYSADDISSADQTVQATTDGEGDRGLIVYDSRHSDHRPNTEPTDYLESGHALENPGTPILYEPVSFSNNMYGRIIFMVGASPSHVGNWHPMGMKEGRDAATFRAAVFGRLELLGEPIGTKKIVAKLDWVRSPIFVDTDDYYHLLLSVIKTWPGWRLADQESQCIVYVTLES